jgi:hypothetical protein
MKRHATSMVVAALAAALFGPAPASAQPVASSGLPASHVQAHATPDPSLLAWWRFDEGMGTTAVDLSGHGHQGSVTGATWTAGHGGGYALAFDGQTASVRVPWSASLEPGQVSVAAWVKGNAPEPPGASILKAGYSGCMQTSYGLATGPSGGLVFEVGNGGAPSASPEANSVWDGQWHRVVGTYDGSTVQLYVDGSEVGAGTDAPYQLDYPFPAHDPLVMGSNRADCGSNTPQWTGTLDEVAIYARPLASAEIAADAAAVTGPDTTVEALGVGISPTTFYPVKDGYLDTLAIRGTLAEPASVGVEIYSVSTGTKVRNLAIGRAAGPYSLSWNGRNVGGTLQPAGKYKVVQTLRDDAGNVLTSASVVTLSRQQMYYYSATVQLNGDAAKLAGGSSAFGSFFYGHEVIAYSTGLQGDTPEGRLLTLEYQFKLPATPRQSLTFGVYSTCPAGSGGATITVADTTGNFGPTARTGCRSGWHSVTVPVSSYVTSKHTVEGDVYLTTWPPGYDGIAIYLARVQYTYGVLR